MFQTPVEIPTVNYKLTYESHVLTMGSCFADNMGKRMQNAWFDVGVNPFGVLYNPASISNGIRRLIRTEAFTPSDLFEARGLWNSFAHSTLFSGQTPDDSLKAMNDAFYSGVSKLEGGCCLIITFGTAWIYENVHDGQVVANCHKLPSSFFRRKRLSVDEIVSDYASLLTELKSTYPDSHIVLSVSPVRHWKDGAHENNLSKSILLLAAEELAQHFDFVDYFPAYEIQMDELRDYRFYSADMLHPSDVAVDYIWKRFADTFFDNETQIIKSELEKYAASLNHKILFPESEEMRKFQLSLQRKRTELCGKYPFLQSRLSC